MAVANLKNEPLLWSKGTELSNAEIDCNPSKGRYEARHIALRRRYEPDDTKFVIVEADQSAEEATMSKKARIADVDVAYEVVGEGTPLTLLHLLFDTKEFWWRSGYVDALRSEGRHLILIDARGPGESSKPHEKEPYALRPRADEVAAVLDDLKIEATEVLGYSMGGWTALGLVCHHPDRLKKAAIGGTSPYAQDLQPLRDVIAKGPRAWVDFFASRATELPPDMQKRVQANDQRALAALVAENRPDISEHVASSAVPLLFRLAACLLPRNRL
jgi:pimeloyl-ACP methyl ester carboxylesterase